MWSWLVTLSMAWDLSSGSCLLLPKPPEPRRTEDYILEYTPAYFPLWEPSSACVVFFSCLKKCSLCLYVTGPGPRGAATPQQLYDSCPTWSLRYLPFILHLPQLVLIKKLKRETAHGLKASPNQFLPFSVSDSSHQSKLSIKWGSWPFQGTCCLMGSIPSPQLCTCLTDVKHAYCKLAFLLWRTDSTSWVSPCWTNGVCVQKLANNFPRPPDIRLV